LFDGTSTSPRFAGVFGGGEVGYNYQIGKWVVGAEGDIGWTNANGAKACPGSFVGFFFTCENRMNWMSSATARLGYAYWDRVLWYVKGGLAVADFKAQVSCNTDSQVLIVGALPGCPHQSTTKTATGWTLGFGTEFGLTENWSVKSETRYYDLGNHHFKFGPLEPDAIVHKKGFIATIGLNYRFGGPAPVIPIVAKY
jgi:opacity protein-like surface antigen